MFEQRGRERATHNFQKLLANSNAFDVKETVAPI
jgi:hypothetical protein